MVIFWPFFGKDWENPTAVTQGIISPLTSIEKTCVPLGGAEEATGSDVTVPVAVLFFRYGIFIY